jgi:outer membrane biosynthesis protein TonB
MNKKNYSLSFIISAIIYTSLIFGYFFFINKNHTIKKKPQTQKIKIALISPPKIVQKPKEMPKKIVSTPLIVPQPIIKKPIKKKIEKPKKKKVKRRIKKKKPKKVIKKIIKKKKVTKKKKIVKKVVHKKIKKTKHTKKVIKKRKKPIKKKEEIIVYNEPQPIKHTKREKIQRVYEEEYIQPTTTIIATPEENTPKMLRTPIVAPKKIIHHSNHISKKKDTHKENIKREFLTKVRETIYANKQYPLRAKRNHIQGRVHVVFDILANGKAVNIRMDNAPRVLKKAVYRSLRKSFPVDIPPSIASEFPIRGISVNVNFVLH